MWCCHCQQDVPAVARTADGPLVCPRCESDLDEVADVAQACAHPADTGVLLDHFDEIADPAPPIKPWESDETRRRLQAIGRQLRTAYRHDPGFATAPPPHSWGPEALASLADADKLQSVKRRAKRKAIDPSSPTVVGRLIGVLLVAGIFGFAGGAGLLVWAVAFQLPQSWQWGMTATIAAEGILIVGLTWMAGRLWRNSRHLNRQLTGVDCQLHELERLTGSLAGNRMSSSQQYYEHFHQGASSHMLLANLRGQVDQLASRIG